MEELISYIYLLMASRYFIEIESGPVCTRKEWDLDCICIPGEIINQAVNILLNIYDLPEFESDLSFLDGNTICPIICKKEIPNAAKDYDLYFGIKKDDKWGFDLSSVELMPCTEGDNGRSYVKLLKDKGMDAVELKKRLHQMQEFADLHLTRRDTLGTGRFEFSLCIIKRIRILKNRKMVHFCLLGQALFIAPGNTLKTISHYLDKKEPGDTELEILCDFFKIYLGFLCALQDEYYKENRIAPFFISKLFLKSWEIDASQIIAEYLNDTDFCDHSVEQLRNMIEDSIRVNVRSLKAFKKLIELLKKHITTSSLEKSLEELEDDVATIGNRYNSYKNRIKKGA